MQFCPYKPDSANCTLLIPVLRTSSRAKWLDVDSAPHISLRLHADHLSAKSVLLKALLSGVSSLDLIENASPSCLRHSVTFHPPRSRLPRILPSPSSHPVVFLPVPDPSSIQLLVHWMYFGNTDYIENSLDQGVIQWQGLASNVEYLGLPTDIKVFLGRWYRNWLLPARDCPSCTDDEIDDNDDEECEGEECDDL